MSSSTSVPFFSMGLSTYQVPKEMFSENRNKLLQNLRKELPNHDCMVYLEGGNTVTRFDTDHEPIFRQESYFHYLFGVREPDFRGGINIKSGESYLFCPKLPQEYATIMGHIPTCEEIKNEYLVDHVMYVSDAEQVLESFCKGGGQILLMRGVNSDSGNEYTPPSFDSKDIVCDEKILFPILAECRVQKSQKELDLIRYCTEITSLGHVWTMQKMKPGMMEYQGESLFRHFIYFNYGSRHVGYTSICGCGPNAAILHYGHSGEPNARQLKDGETALFDMGAEYYCYGSDITCSFPVSSNGKFTEKQKIVYEGVLNAQRRVIQMLKPGVSYRDCHKAAEGEILKALVKLDIVRPGSKTIDELVEMRLGAVFMPHGLGHFIGIDTHDVGGYLPNHPERSSGPGLKSLRTARQMKTNMTLTVEPGCYFIDHLIDKAIEEDSPLREYLNADELNSFRGFGGTRLEDVVAITDHGCENFTICPRTVNEVEHVMAGGKWPPTKDEDPTLKRLRLTSGGSYSVPVSTPI